MISCQVVQEALNVFGRKLGATAGQQLKIFDNVLSCLWRTHPTADLYRRAVAISRRYRFGFYDSLVVAAALEYGCDLLYSEDLLDGQVIDTVTIRNPFLNLAQTAVSRPPAYFPSQRDAVPVDARSHPIAFHRQIGGQP